MQVDLPLPECPHSATVFPAGAVKETSVRTCCSKRAGYVKSTLEKVISPSNFSGFKPSVDSESISGSRSMISKILKAAPWAVAKYSAF